LQKTREGAIASIEHAAIARAVEDLALPKPEEGARVFASVDSHEWLDKTSWAGVPAETVEPGVGSNEASGAVAFAAAVRAIEGGTSSALVFGARRNEVYAFVLRRA
jgi:hypothetical protein